MWGSSFADLAKKAQELQEQAEQAISTTATPSSFFNLDAMQQTEEPKQPPRVVPTTTLPLKSSSPSVRLEPVVQHSKSPVPKGKLQVFKKSPPKSTTTSIETTSLPVAPLETPKEQQSSDILVVTEDDEPVKDTNGEKEDDGNDDNNGWAEEEEELDLDDENDDEDEKESMEEKVVTEETMEKTKDLAPEQKVTAIHDEETTDHEEVNALERGETEAKDTQQNNEYSQVESPQAKTAEAVSETDETTRSTPMTTVPSEPPMDQNENSTKEEADPIKNQESVNGDISSHNDESPPVQQNSMLDNDQLLKQFSEQMKRVEENHQTEQMEMEQRHARELEKTKTEAAAAQQALQERFMSEIREKDQQLHEVMRTNEGQKLKLDMLQREVTGTQKLLDAKKSDMGSMTEANLRQLRKMETEMRKTEESVNKERESVKSLEENLKSKEDELAASRQEHADLKARVKTVAGELKERRQECRELKNNIVSQQEVEQELRSKIEQLEFQLSDREKNSSETSEEMEQLRVKVIDSTRDIEKLKKAMQEQKEAHETALVEYKKKAQSSLALANSRTAAAVQSKEEAELEARAARSTADTAMERAVHAELESKQALAEAKSRVLQMETEKDKAMNESKEALQELATLRGKLEEIQDAFHKATTAKNEAAAEFEATRTDLSTEKVRTEALSSELNECKRKLASQQREIVAVKEKLWHAEQNAAATADKEAEPSAVTTLPDTDHQSVSILQQELQDANDAIEDLKLALKNAVEADEKKSSDLDSSEASKHHELGHSHSNGSTPLFYAMEKQVELNAARSEINRLANMLSNVQSEKMEAFEGMEEMRQRMEVAEARLMRYEKLRPASSDTNVTTDQDNGVASSDSGAVNIEYLKNIMLSYLNAKTSTERKSLVPVIGAVLCLTPDEQAKAMHNVEESATLGGVGHSLFESISGNLLGK